ncbi:MAG: ribonuclease P protein component [Candidatus Levyibacteriota bacterium]
MLKKKYRLPANVRLGKAETISAKYFILKTASSSLPYPRFAFVISKKVDRRAVIRNRIKREMASSIQRLIDKVSPGKDMVFILKRSAVESMPLLARSVKDVFLQEGLSK